MRSPRPALLLVVLATLLTGCIGNFRLTNRILEFNKDISNEIVVQEILFLAMLIVPVYPVSLVIDAVALNTIEFATGNNPIAGALPPPGESRFVRLDDGGELIVSNHGADLQLVVSRPGEPEVVHVVERRRDAVRLIDALGRTVAEARPRGDGGVAVTDATGGIIAEHDPLAVHEALEAWQIDGAHGLTRQLTGSGSR